MKKGNLYQHSNNTDVAIYVCHVFKTSEYIKVRVQWFNVVNPNNKFNMNLSETIKIKYDDLKNWKYIG